jgi:hypothetical protein
MAWAAVAGAAGSVIGGIIGGPSGAQKRLARSQQQQIDAQTAALKDKSAGFNSLWGQANQLSTNPADHVAGLSPQQLQAAQLVQGNLGVGAAGADALASRVAGQNLGGVSAEDISRFQDPYTDSVVNAAGNDIEKMRQRQIAGNASSAELSHAFGGDRQGVVDAGTNEAAIRTFANTSAGLRSQGYQQATNAAMQEANQKGQYTLTGNQQLTQLLAARNSSNAGDIAQVGAVGDLQRGVNQQGLDWSTNRLGTLNSILNGYTPQASNFQGAGANLAPNGFASAVQGAQWGSQVGSGIANYFSPQQPQVQTGYTPGNVAMNGGFTPPSLGANPFKI